MWVQAVQLYGNSGANKSHDRGHKVGGGYQEHSGNSSLQQQFHQQNRVEATSPVKETRTESSSEQEVTHVVANQDSNGVVVGEDQSMSNLRESRKQLAGYNKQPALAVKKTDLENRATRRERQMQMGGKLKNQMLRANKSLKSHIRMAEAQDSVIEEEDADKGHN